MSDTPPPLPPEWEAFIEAEPAVVCEDPEAPLAFWVARMLQGGFSREQVVNMLMCEAKRVALPLERAKRTEQEFLEAYQKRIAEIEERAKRERAFRRAQRSFHNRNAAPGWSAFWGGGV